MPTTGYVTTPRPEQIGAWLKRERVRDGRFSQEQVAPLVGATTRTVGAWERGETMPDADQLFFLCGLYGVRAIDLQAITQIVVPVRPPNVTAERKAELDRELVEIRAKSAQQARPPKRTGSDRR